MSIPIPLNDLQPRLSPQATDLLPTLPVGAQVLESTTRGQLAGKAPYFFVSGGGSVIPTGVVGVIKCPFALTLSSVNLAANASGSVVVDIGLVAIASWTGSFINSITSSSQPTLTSAIEYDDEVLSGWTKAIPANNYLIFKIVSVSAIDWLAITLGANS